MKKITLLVCLITLSVVKVFSQDFTLTADGFVSKNDESKNFIVVEMDGSQQELYKKAKNYLMKIYRSPKDVLSESEPETITINGISKDVVQKKALGMVVISYDMNYTVVLMFKDGKIRIDAPTFSLASYQTKTTRLLLKGKSNGGFGAEVINTIYNNNGKLKEKYAKEQLELYFNSYIHALVKGMKETENNDW